MAYDSRLPTDPRRTHDGGQGTALDAALREIGRSLAYPDAARIVVAVGARIDALPAPASAPWWQRITGGHDGLTIPPRARTVRRSMVLALIALIVAVAVVGAAVLGLPGLRFVFGPPPVTLPPATSSAAPSSATLGSTLGLGLPTGLGDLDRVAGFHVTLPGDPALGPPDAAWFDSTKGTGVVTLVWSPRPGYPAVDENGIGLLVGEFRGRLDDGYFEKAINQAIDIERVSVNGQRGFWIAGAPHFFFWVGPDGRAVDDTIRLVGQVLAWQRDGLTLRMESTLRRDQAIELAVAFR
jgi:hypothetical protein